MIKDFQKEMMTFLSLSGAPTEVLAAHRFTSNPSESYKIDVTVRHNHEILVLFVASLGLFKSCLQFRDPPCLGAEHRPESILVASFSL
jgi:hypothetical protein